MTTPSPYAVKHVVLARVWSEPSGEFQDLNVKSIRASMDMDRVNFCEATLVCVDVTDEQLLALDPREQVPLSEFAPVRWSIEQFDEDDVLIGRLPGAGFSSGALAEMWVRTIEPDYMTGEVTIHLAGGESMMSDKKALALADTDTGATTVSELVGYALTGTFGSAVISNAPITVSTAIPAGERRMRMIGESYIDLIQSELDALDCRLYDIWGLLWQTAVRSTLGATLSLCTYMPAPAGSDPIVTSFRRTITRDGDFADGVLAIFDYTPSGGSRTLAYQRTGAGANTKGRVKTYNRAKPVDNVAEQLLSRTIIRGDDIDITARARFDFYPGWELEVHSRLATLTGIIRSVEWDTETGLMTIKAQTGVPT